MILVRHGEGHWNTHFHESRVDVAIADPGLTERGREQAAMAADRLREHAPGRIVTSPYRRTLQTALIIAERLGLDISVDPLVRERCAFACDQGTPASHLARLWPDIDFAGLEEIWWGRRIESQLSLAGRVDRFAAAMARTDDWQRLAVVSHWGFIRASTGRTVGNAELVRWSIDNQGSPEVLPRARQA